MGIMLLITKHYFVRCFKEPIALLSQILLPLGIVIMNLMLDGSSDPLFNGYNVVATIMGPLMLFSFQIFGSYQMSESAFQSFEGPTSERLNMAPIKPVTLFMGTALGTVFSNLIQGSIIILVLKFAFDADWGNPLVLIAALLTMTLITTFIGFLLYRLSPNMKSANTISLVISFSILAMNNAIGDLSGIPALNYISVYNPVGLAARAVLYSGIAPEVAELGGNIPFVGGGLGSSWQYLLALLGWLAALAVISLILGNRKKL